MKINFFLLVLWGFLQQIWNFTFRTQQQNNVFPSRDKILQGKFWRNPACIYILPMQPPRISHSFHWWSDWLTHPLPGICKLKVGSCHTPARESASSTGAAPSRSRDQALPKAAELHEPLHVPRETAMCWWRASKLRLLVPRIWEGSGTCRSTSRSWWEPRPVHRRTWKSSELLLPFLHQPQPCSACDVMLYIKAWTEISWKPKFWLKPPLPTRSGGPSTPPLGEEGLLTQGKKSRVPTFHCENYTAFPVGNS